MIVEMTVESIQAALKKKIPLEASDWTGKWWPVLEADTIILAKQERLAIRPCQAPGMYIVVHGLRQAEKPFETESLNAGKANDRRKKASQSQPAYDEPL